jgi:hypothetical protein
MVTKPHTNSTDERIDQARSLKLEADRQAMAEAERNEKHAG